MLFFDGPFLPMSSRKPDRNELGDRDELGERADEIFERKVRPQVDVEQEARKFVVIDVASEDFEVDANQRSAVDRLIERRPEAQGQTLWSRRVGSPFAHSFGGRRAWEEWEERETET